MSEILMNKYTCTKCKTVVVVHSTEPKLTVNCSTCKTSTEHTVVGQVSKLNPNLVVRESAAPAIKPSVTPKPATKLDVSSGPVTAKAN